MSKSEWGILVSFFFAIVGLVAPIPGHWRIGIFGFASLGLVVSCVGWYRAYRKERKKETQPPKAIIPEAYRPRVDVWAFRELNDNYIRGMKIEAEIIGFPERGVTQGDYEDMDRWWKAAVGILNRNIFSSFLSPGDLASLDALDDDGINMPSCRPTGGPADEERLVQCHRRRLERVRELIRKIEHSRSVN